ncbi:hypothetical protein [Ralstonia syzygii]|uniref:Lipoprotein n=1 Tax=Ralstonia syzygii R24 TaxID=907261 RepID=G3A2Y4_9RALS|nr:hypothetical protein [Ralstonia syzygii]CCA85805.1 exported hypothetical protein [Ralstonia syzygii R24]
MKTIRMIFLRASLVAAVIGLCACTSYHYPSESERKVAAVQAKFPRYQFIVVRCDNSNAISDAVMAGALRSGASSANAKAIIDLLSKPESPYVAVLGDGDTIAAATLERALSDSKGKVRAGRTVIFVGDQKYEQSLKAAAMGAGVKLEFVSFTN